LIGNDWLREVGVEREDAGSVEAEIFGGEFPIALEQEGRSGNENKSERDFGNYEDASQSCALASAASSSREHRAQIGLRGFPCREDAEDERGEQ
jgi:hypothetical protein